MSFIDIERIRARFLILETLNVFQPAEKTCLVERLKGRVNAQQVEAILDELVKENRAVEEKGRYRLTRHGYKTIIPGKGRKLRDVYRMKYLFEITQQRGGGDSRTTFRRP
jgi:predicted transcriptional regulator